MGEEGDGAEWRGSRCCVEGRQVVLSGGEAGAVWRGGRWYRVEGEGMVLCGGEMDDAVWRGGRCC